MGIFGEAIHGHIGQYKTSVYGAAINAGQLVRANGLSEQQVDNLILGSASIGLNDSENHIIMFDSEGSGVSWSLRIAPQGNSMVSAGYSHIAYWKSSLSVFRNLDNVIYFPFIKEGAEVSYLLQNDAQFNSLRWPDPQSVKAWKEQQMQLLGKPVVLPSQLLKRVIFYILSKISTNARKYLYILVPQGVPYQAYCEDVTAQILSCIPVGLRKGIAVATNPAQKDEDSFGIIFQKESNPAKHACDLSFHRNENYSFLNYYYLEKNVENLISLFVDNPCMVENCYKEMEVPIFGDRLPGSMTPYDNYYGISQLHVNTDRPEYLEDCNNLLGQTQSGSQQRKLVESAISSEISSKDACLTFIEKDKDFLSIKDRSQLNEYLKRRRNLIGYLNTVGIDFKTLFLYKKLEEICRRNNKNTEEEICREIITMMPGLTELTDSEKESCRDIARKKAWDEFEQSLPFYKVQLPTDSKGVPYYTPDSIRTLLNARNSTSGWSVEDAFEHYDSLVKLSPENPPMNMVMWHRRLKRVQALSVLFEKVNAGNVSGSDAQIVKDKLDRVLEYSAADSSVQDSQEASSALTCVQRLYEKHAKQSPKASSAIEVEKNLIEIHDRCMLAYKMKNENEDGSLYEKALYWQMVSYLEASTDPDMYKRALHVAQTELRDGKIKNAYLYHINESAVLLIDDSPTPYVKCEIYSAIKETTLFKNLQEAYEAWVCSELKQGKLEASTLKNLYESVFNPSSKLTDIYENWKRMESERRGIKELIMTSNTYVRYLQAVRKRSTGADEPENRELREKLWERLSHEERDISSFLGAVSYIFETEPLAFLRSNDTEARKILEEFRYLVDRDGSCLGVLLREEESIQELYQRVWTFENLVEIDVSEIQLYSLNDFSGFTYLRKEKDVGGKIATIRNFALSDVENVLSRIIEIQNKLHKKGGAEEAAKSLNTETYKEILSFLEKAGVFDGKSDLEDAFKLIGLNVTGKARGKQKYNSAILRFVPYIGWVFAAVFCAAFVWSMISGGKTPGHNTKTDITPKDESVALMDDSASVSESDASKRDRKKGDSDAGESTLPESENTSASGENAAPANENTSSSSKDAPSGEENAASVSDNTSVEGENAPSSEEAQNDSTIKEATFSDGKLVSNRVPGDNNRAIRAGNGYDVNGDGKADLFPVYATNPETGREVLTGFGFRRDDTADIVAIRENNKIIGYDTNQDGQPDSRPISGQAGEQNGVDLDGDGIHEIGFDLDGDGMCEIGFAEF